MFRETPLSEVIPTLSQQWGINIVAGAEVQGSVSGNFKDSSLREILDSLLLVNGYGYQLNGNSLLVLKSDQIGPSNPNFRAETMLLPRQLGNEATEQIVGALRVFSSPNGGQLQAVPSSNTLMVHDTPERIEQMRAMLQTLTQSQPTNAGILTGGPANSTFPPGILQASVSNEILTLRPQFVSVTEIAKGVELAIGSQATFTIIEGEEAMLVHGTRDVLKRASYVLSQLDRPRSQVRITAYIYDVALGETERLGWDWSNQFMSQSIDSNGIPRNNIRADGGLLSRSVATPLVGTPSALGGTTSASTAGAATGAAAAPAAVAPTGGQWVFRTLSSNFELNTVLQALDETKGAKLLADPHVTVIDRQTASIDIVTKIPIQQLTQTQQGGSIGTTAFEEAGIKLSVTPRVADDHTVQLNVTPEFSVLTGFNSTGNPIIDARRASTIVRIGNQQTLVIGGLRQKTMVETIRGIPGIMNWKYVGRLFRTHNTEMRESELIVFLQPEIVDTQTTGLEREQIALDLQKLQLSRISLACPGPMVPDCRDPNCPYHHPRPRPNRGQYDEGLVHPAHFDSPARPWEQIQPALHGVAPDDPATNPEPVLPSAASVVLPVRPFLP
jgi:general secretion pathway protein D